MPRTMICKNIFALLTVLLAGMAVAQDKGSVWHDSFYPYRVHIALNGPAAGKVEIKASTPQLTDALKGVLLDTANQETLAYDKAILVDPASGTQVGRFELVPDGEPIDIDGDFSKGTGAWQGIAAADIKPVEGDEPFNAYWVEGTEIQNRSASQPVLLQAGKLYLLQYSLWCEPIDGAISIAINNPAKRLFSELPHSYYLPMPAIGQWTRQSVLYAPEVNEAELRIATGFVGKGAIGKITLQPVRWALTADLPAESGAVDLYLVFHAGHRYALPKDVAVRGEALASVEAKSLLGESIDFNPDGLVIEGDEHISAWTVPSYLPMEEKTVRLTRPRGEASKAANKPLPITLLQGESATVVIAVDAGTPAASFDNLQCDLPLKTTVQRIATIPVYDSFYPAGKKYQTRYDALVDLDFDQMPASGNGVHLLALTVAADAETAAGHHDGTLAFRVTNQEPASAEFTFPIDVSVIPVLSKPTHHFGTLFGGQHMTAKYPKSAGYFKRDSTTVAEFHGYNQGGKGDESMSRLSRPDIPQPERKPIRALARKYYERMLDYALVPQSLTLFSTYTYTITDNGDGKAPTLSNWDFTEFDTAIDELVIKRDVPWLTLWHMNGHSIDHFELSDGVTYTMRENSPIEGARLLPKEEYQKLLADYFDTLAKHLQEKGCLDRTIIIIDESAPYTYQTMYDVVSALREREFARHIRYGHTSYHTAVYTKEMADGKLIMDEVLDVPMPDNDEHFNFFEPEYAKRLQREGKQNWVYYVESDHLNLEAAGLSTVITPLKLRSMGVTGWYCWASFLWSLPYHDDNIIGWKYPNGPTLNPWLNPYNNHGPGVVSFFYPPDPRGPAAEETDRIVPSYRLALMRDGIQDYARLALLAAGKDDRGNAIAANAEAADQAERVLQKLWVGNPVQWYLSYDSYRQARQSLNEAFSR